MRTGAVVVTQSEKKTPDGETVRTFLDAGKNPPDGIIVTYHLNEQPEGEVNLTFQDAKGQGIRSFSSSAEEAEQRVPSKAGMNRFVWNMRYPEPRRIAGDSATERGLLGPLAPPGTYQVTLEVGGQTYTESFELQRDPRVAVPQEEIEAQFALLMQVRDKLSEAHDAVLQIRGVRKQVEEWLERTQSGEAVQGPAEELKGKLAAIEKELIFTGKLPSTPFANWLFPAPAPLNAKLLALANSLAGSAAAAPTKQTSELYGELSSQVNQQLVRLKDVIDNDVSAFNNLIWELELPGVAPKSSP